MKWIGLLSIVVLVSSGVVVAEDSFFGGRGNLRSVEHRAAPESEVDLVATPLVWEDFPDYAGYGSYHGLGFTGPCCEHPSLYAQQLWDYPDANACDTGHAHSCWLAECLRRWRERRQARRCECHHGCDACDVHHRGRLWHRRRHGGHEMDAPYDPYAAPPHFGPEYHPPHYPEHFQPDAYGYPDAYDYPVPGPPALELPPPPPLPEPSSLRQPGDAPRTPGFFQDRSAARRLRQMD